MAGGNKKDNVVRRAFVLTGGGDCAGLNPAVKWTVKGLLEPGLVEARGTQFEVWGVRRGWAGFVNAGRDGLNDPESFVRLKPEIVRTWDRFGGTNLSSSRTNPCKDPKIFAKTLQNIRRLKADALIAIGGEDTLGVALALREEGVNIVGIPKTIDKDLCGTDYSLGFSTSVQIITEEIDRLRTTAGSHDRVFVVETMGRHAGHLAMQGGIAGGACMILIPESPFEIEKVYDTLMERKKLGARYDIVVIAEGAKPRKRHELVVTSRTVDEFGHERLGGVGAYLTRELEKMGMKEVRFVVLSHLQRGGTPTAYDRRIGRAFGLAAAELVHKRDFGKMVSLRDNKITSAPIEAAIRKDRKGKTKLNLVDIDLEYDTERLIPKRRALGMKMF